MRCLRHSKRFSWRFHSLHLSHISRARFFFFASVPFGYRPIHMDINMYIDSKPNGINCLLLIPIALVLPSTNGFIHESSSCLHNNYFLLILPICLHSLFASMLTRNIAEQHRILHSNTHTHNVLSLSASLAICSTQCVRYEADS